MDLDAPQCSVDFARLADPMKDVITCERGGMVFDGVDVAGMAETTPTPFFLFSAAQIDRNIAALRDAFRQFHPATRVFYASKACSNLWFLDRVRRAGIDIEVNSGGELWKARKAGFEPRQIIFNGVAKTRARWPRRSKGPSRRIVVDSVFELRRIADVAADLRKQARVALRVDLNVASETHPGLRTSKGAKAGIDVNEALGAFGLAAQLPNIDLVGMHYHIGSQITRVEPVHRGARGRAGAPDAHRDGARHPPRAPQHRRRLRDPLLRPHRRRAGHVLRGAAHAGGLRPRDRRARGGGAPGPPALSWSRAAPSPATALSS